jgi:tetratricopeptide (TPR) repeat protein
MRDQAYFNQRFWLSCRYYTIGKWEDAQRNLTEAIRLRPELLDPEPLERMPDLLHLFCTNALDPRVEDPVGFTNAVFDHLPAAVDRVIRPYQPYLLSWVYAGLAMRNYAHGKIAEAKRQFAQAITLDRSVVERVDDFARALCDYALRLPVRPLLYVDTVLQNLPPEGKMLGQLRSRVLSELSIATAFQDYVTGKRRRVPRKVLTALRYRPSLLANRGVVSIFVKSLPQAMSRARAPQANAAISGQSAG